MRAQEKTVSFVSFVSIVSAVAAILFLMNEHIGDAQNRLAVISPEHPEGHPAAHSFRSVAHTDRSFEWRRSQACAASEPAMVIATQIPKSPRDGYSTMSRKKKEKMEMPVCARVSASKFHTLEIWCDNSFRKRSEVVGIVLERVLEILEQQASVRQPVEEFVRRLRIDPS